MRIGVIIGSVRDKRFGEQVGAWVAESVSDRTDADIELVDLKAFDVPVLTSSVHPMRANKKYDDERVQKWSDAIDALDAYVFITPEYNHGVPGAFKNAVDSLGSEWSGKPVAFIGYGSVGGVRAIEQWRQIVLNFSMVPVRAEVNINMFFDAADGVLKPLDRRAGELKALFDALIAAKG